MKSFVLAAAVVALSALPAFAQCANGVCTTAPVVRAVSHVRVAASSAVCSVKVATAQTFVHRPGGRVLHAVTHPFGGKFRRGRGCGR